MHRSLAGSGIRARLLAGLALICVLPASVASDVTARAKHVFGRRTAVIILRAQLVGSVHSQRSTSRGSLSTGHAEIEQICAAMRDELDRSPGFRPAGAKLQES